MKISKFLYILESINLDVSRLDSQTGKLVRIEQSLLKAGIPFYRNNQTGGISLGLGKCCESKKASSKVFLFWLDCCKECEFSA